MTCESCDRWKASSEEHKQRYEEVCQELEEYTENSAELERELSLQVQQAEKENKALVSRNESLQTELDRLRERYESFSESSNRQLCEVQGELAQVEAYKDKLEHYVQELEQMNDDLERAKRETVASLQDFESRLNQAIERNAILESELDDKDTLMETVQRLKDEARDMREELNVKDLLETKRPSTPGKEILSRGGAPVIRRGSTSNPNSAAPGNSNTVFESGSPPVNFRLSGSIAMDTSPALQPPSALAGQPSVPRSPQAHPPSSLKFGGPAGAPHGMSPLSPSARISALSIVGDLLRKVGALESKLASCRNFVKDHNSKPVALSSQRKNSKLPGNHTGIAAQASSSQQTIGITL